MPHPDRRTFLTLGLPGWGAITALHAQAQPAGQTKSPRIGADPLLTSSGITSRWEAGMRQDLGWAAQFETMRTSEVLRALEQGALDAGIFLTHPRAEALDKDGLIFDRHTLARTDVLLVGPEEDIAGIRGESDATRAMKQVLAACRAGVASWHPLEANSPLEALAHRLSDGQLRAALSLAASLQAGQPLPTYRLMTRAQWHLTASQNKGAKIWLSGQPDLVMQAQVACSFHARHPGAKLLVKWLQWPLAQQALRPRQTGWTGIKG